MFFAVLGLEKRQCLSAVVTFIANFHRESGVHLGDKTTACFPEFTVGNSCASLRCGAEPSIIQQLSPACQIIAVCPQR
jgi:hypothetical protein